MGLLDEAIREHLDLKRRRGADPEEVERAEREALGPVRRGPDELDQPAMDALPDQDLPTDEDPGADHGLAYDHEQDEWDEEFEDEELEPSADGHEAPIAPEHEAPLADESEEPWAHEPPLTTDEPATGAVPAPHPADEPVGHLADPEHHLTEPERPHDTTSEETAEYQVEFEEDEGDREGEQLLEETPEFLQDTPDHDRLWFEQRPPKDFDFDG